MHHENQKSLSEHCDIQHCRQSFLVHHFKPVVGWHNVLSVFCIKQMRTCVRTLPFSFETFLKLFK